MKKLLTIAFAMLLGASMSFAQATGSTDKPAGKTDTKTATKTTDTKSGKKGHKGGKKGKKGSTSTTTPPPK